MRLKLIAFSAALVMSAGIASAQDKTFELRLAHWVPPSHPLQKALEDWAAAVEKDRTSPYHLPMRLGTSSP